ncbi:MAG TPA: hypothetical protein VEG60_21780 [Candidatus Binatia bacterium]|nr:hypothetical protein [Candidatus Binatia bacterium]
MKKTLFAGTLLALLVLGSRDLRAQAYGPYYYDPYLDVQYQQYLHYAQTYDPYYQLHVMHYQLYLPQYTYQLYQPCCYAAVIPQWSVPIRPHPRPVISSRPHRVHSPRSRAVVGPLPRAVGPLPRATGRR